MNAPKPFHEMRPWGEELWLTRDTGSPSMVKVITVNPGESLSLQFHNKRDEYWTIISGDGIAEIGTNRIILHEGMNAFVPRKTNHRITGGKNKLILVEVTFGDFDESDIVRLEDKYGRINQSSA